MINLVIINTKVVIYKRKPEKGELRIHKVLRLTYYEMINDQNVCDLSHKTEHFENRWEKVQLCLSSQFE